MTFVEVRRITFSIRLTSTQAMPIQAVAHLDTAPFSFLAQHPTRGRDKVRINSRQQPNGAFFFLIGGWQHVNRTSNGA